VFDYGHKEAADQMRTSWEMIVEYVGTNYGQTISNELQNNKLTVVLPEPTHSAAILARHATRSAMIRTAQQKDVQDARDEQLMDLEAEVTAGVDKMAKMRNSSF
jgi:protein-disulfide isomerase-like protein with CxxC motif